MIGTATLDTTATVAAEDPATGPAGLNLPPGSDNGLADGGDGGGNAADGSGGNGPADPPTATLGRRSDATERAIARMLLENTGAALMDSGGAYGRAWQHARARYGLAVSPNSTFSGAPLGPDPDPTPPTLDRVARMMRAEPSATLDTYGSVTASAFHYLTDRLAYDRALDARWQRWAHRPHPDAVAERATLAAEGRLEADGWRVYDEWAHESWPETIERYLDMLRASGATIGGLYGDSSGPLSENTYNGPDLLDRTLQWWLFTVEYAGPSGEWRGVGRPGTPGYREAWHEFRRPLPEGTYTLLQVHGGADVRGGYTSPVLFVTREPEGLVDSVRVGVSCDGNAAREAAWEAQTGYWQRSEYGGRVSPVTAEILYGPEDVAHEWDTSYDGETLRTEAGARLVAGTAEDLARSAERDAEWRRDHPPADPDAEWVKREERERDATEYAVIREDGSWQCPRCDGTLIAWAS